MFYIILQDNIKGELSFNNLFFRYPNRSEVKVLQDVDIKVKSGQTLALVGASGSGKTTLFSLIERFYDPTSGTVQLEGISYQHLNIRWLRSQVGVVSQEPVLFDLSIADNIRYGANDREVSDAEVEAAARAANIHDFITTLTHVCCCSLSLVHVHPPTHTHTHTLSTPMLPGDKVSTVSQVSSFLTMNVYDRCNIVHWDISPSTCRVMPQTSVQEEPNWVVGRNNEWPLLELSSTTQLSCCWMKPLLRWMTLTSP